MKKISEYNSLTEKINAAFLGNIISDGGNQQDFSEPSTSRVKPSLVDQEINEHVRFLDTNYRNRLIVMIYHEDFYPGESNETIAFVGSLRRYSDVALVLWFTKLYADYINTPPVLLGLLYIILYYDTVFKEMLITTAHAAISNESAEVQELGVRMLESRCCKEHFEALKSLKKQEPWLQGYINKVKRDFEKQLCQF